MRNVISLIVFCLLWVGGTAAGAIAADPAAYGYQTRGSPYMHVYGVTEPPYGFVDFCRRMPEECEVGIVREGRVAGTAEELAVLDSVNRKVNKDIKPATDMEVYGVEDYWTIPTTRGDCEDYALLKRQTLMRMGWPASALLVTVVLDEYNQGHAVLTARTLYGDLILDNKTDELKLWHQTPYSYLMRQSYLNPLVWMSLDPDKAATSIPVAGPRKTKR